jgi:DnaK suppressor protein
VDAALDSAQDEITSQLAEVESRELASIESALQRMRDGTYGKCEACGAAIPLARLQALPYAVLCIQCQQEAEDQGGILPAGGNIDWSRFADSGRAGREVSLTDMEMDVP